MTGALERWAEPGIDGYDSREDFISGRWRLSYTGEEAHSDWRAVPHHLW